MGKRSEVPVTERREAVLSFLRREEPGGGYRPARWRCRSNPVSLAG